LVYALWVACLEAVDLIYTRVCPSPLFDRVVARGCHLDKFSLDLSRVELNRVDEEINETRRRALVGLQYILASTFRANHRSYAGTTIQSRIRGPAAHGRHRTHKKKVDNKIMMGRSILPTIRQS
jgi:hypothetical protein